MFGGYGRGAMSLPSFVPLAPGHDEAVHVTDFLEVWASTVPSGSAMDVGPGTSISGPVGFAGGECFERRMGGQDGLPASPSDQEVGMSDDSEDDHPRAPLKPGLHGSRRQGFLGESTPRGGGIGERLQQASRIDDSSSSGRKDRSQVREVRGSDETTRSARRAPAQLQTEASPQREAGGNVAGEDEGFELGLFREKSLEMTQSGGKRNLLGEEEREGVGAMKRQRKEGGSARTPTTREGGSVEKRKRVGGGDETPKESSARRRSGESFEKRSKSSREKKEDEGESGEGDDDVEINLNAFNLDNAFFIEMKTGVQRDVVLHIHPERILPIPDWEDAYNHRSLDEFLVDTIASAMIDCYERKDMRYTKPIFVLAPVVAPLEKDKPVVRVLPGDFDDSHPEKYWYYPVCGQHNARVAMKVKEHPVFNYYNFCKWPFRPIYFPDDEFDGYAHVSCEDNMKDKKNPPRLQVLSMRDIRNIWKIKGKPRVVLRNASKKKEEVRKWVQFIALAMKKTPYTPLWNLSTEGKKKKKWAEKLQYYLPLAMADDSIFAWGEKFYDEWSRGKLLASNGRRWTEKPPTHDEVAKPGLSTVTDSQGLKKHVWYVKVDDPSLKKDKGKAKKGAEEKTYYVQVPEPDVHCGKELVDLTDREKKRLLNGVLNLNVVSRRQLLEEFKDKGLDDKLWNESRNFFTDTAYVNKCPLFLGCQHDNNIKKTVALVNNQHFPAEWKRVILSVITGECAQSKRGPRGIDECINILWTKTSALTTLAQFTVDPLRAIDHKEALGKLGHQLRSHTCVLDLCGNVDRARWDSGTFASLSEFLGFVCQDYWTLVVFVPCLWNLSFMTSLSAHGATRCYTGKWVRKTASKKTHQFGNSVWEELDVMHIIFKGDDQGGRQRGTGGGSEQRSTRQRSPGHEGGGEGGKGSREKKKPRSGEKTKHHRGDGHVSDFDRDEDSGVLAVTGSTSMKTGNDFRPGWITRPGEQDPVISSTSATQFIDVVDGAVVAKDETCFAQLQKRLADCLGSIRTTETTTLSGTHCLEGSETTTYHGSDSHKLEPCSVLPQKEVRINPNPEANTVERVQRSMELERVVLVSENPGGEIRIHPNQEDVSAMTDDRCKDAVMLRIEVCKELEAHCPAEGELATSFNVESRTLGDECLVAVRALLPVLSDSPVKTDTSAPLETAGAQMNPNQGPVSMSLHDAALETTLIRMHPRHTDVGLELAGVEGCGHVTTLDKADGSSPTHSADDQIEPTLSGVRFPRVTSGHDMRVVGLEQRGEAVYDDPLYSGLHDEAMGEAILKKASCAVGDSFFYLSDDDKNTAHEDKKLRGGQVLLDIHGTLSPTQYDTLATEKTQPVDVVDVDALCPETDRIKLTVADVEDFRHRDGDEFMPSSVIDADISNLSSFPGGLEHAVAASMRTGAPIVLGLPSVGSGDVEAKPGFPRDGRAVLEDVICSRLPLTIIVARLPSHNLQVSVKDIVALVDGSGELNDEVVNFYMAMLLDDCGRTAATMKTYTFNSFFASTLLLRGPAAVSRWAKDVDLLSHDLILSPVHKDGEHWSFLVIDFSRRVLEIYDSFSCLCCVLRASGLEPRATCASATSYVGPRDGSSW
ncbi:hypothetical protein CBR_g26346 [Chara braunii]|uniref:Ubiquitin-like protease family profile domain-containing protein n=1 Tax=Chara braunii TaxID=69332 RepID=A0A388L7P9_CHABU|nr:hypothetical protein CBR_g26346 [Chara braunii]|eukprot:GBG78317.1 hypothetical protein CBR_g26346 [Chara braunii]